MIVKYWGNHLPFRLLLWILWLIIFLPDEGNAQPGGQPRVNSGRVGKETDSVEYFLERNDFVRAGQAAVRMARRTSAKGNQDISMTLINRAIAIFKKQNLTNELAEAYADKSVFAGKSENPGLALVLLDSANKLISGKTPGPTHMRIFWRKGVTLLLLSRYDESLDQLQHASRLAEKYGDNDVLTQVYLLMGNIAFDLHKKKDAVIHYTKALEVSRKNKNSKFTAICYTCLANLYGYDSTRLAISLYKKTISLNQAQGNDFGLQATYNNLGSLYLYEKKYDSAILFLKKAIGYASKNQDYGSAIAAYGSSATAWAYLKNEEQSRSYLDKALEISRKVNTPRHWVIYYNVLTETEKARGNFENALKAYEKYYQLNDSLTQEKNQQRVAELEVKFKTQQIETENQKLSAKNAKSELDVQRQRFLRDIFLLLSVILFAVAGFIVIILIQIYRSRQKTKKQLEIIDQKNQQIQTLLREIHHSVKNNLGMILSILNLQKRTATNPESLSLIEDVQSRILSIIELHRQLYQNEDPGNIKLKEYFEAIGGKILELYGQQRNKIEYRVNMEKTEVAKKLGLTLGILVSEMITNSIKYAFPDDQPGRIDISMKTNDGLALLEVADNGTGITSLPEKPPAESGLGMRLIRLLTSEIKGKLEVDQEGGTKYSIKFPLA